MHSLFHPAVCNGSGCGGGRYDGPIEHIGGKPTPGVGFGLGLERVLMLMEAEGVKIPEESPVKLYIAALGDEAKVIALKIADRLRKKGVKTEIDHMGRVFKAQFKYADKINAEYVLAIGDDEVASGNAKLKRMSDGSVADITLDGVADFNF